MDARENGCSPAVRVRVSQGEGGSDRGEWYYALGGVVGHGVAGVGGERGRRKWLPRMYIPRARDLLLSLMECACCYTKGCLLFVFCSRSHCGGRSLSLSLSHRGSPSSFPPCLRCRMRLSDDAEDEGGPPACGTHSANFGSALKFPYECAFFFLFLSFLFCLKAGR